MAGDSGALSLDGKRKASGRSLPPPALLNEVYAPDCGPSSFQLEVCQRLVALQCQLEAMSAQLQLQAAPKPPAVFGPPAATGSPEAAVAMLPEVAASRSLLRSQSEAPGLKCACGGAGCGLCGTVSTALCGTASTAVERGQTQEWDSLRAKRMQDLQQAKRASLSHRIATSTNERVGSSGKRRPWAWLTSHWRFEVAVFLAILANSIIIGIEVQLAVDAPGQESPLLEVLGHVCSGIFLVELVMRMLGEGRRFCTSTLWNAFDSVVVLASLVDFTLTVLFMQAAEDTGLSNLRVLRLVRVIRGLRVLRIASIIRHVSALRTLVYSIMVTMRMLVWALLLLGLLIYTFSVLITRAMAHAAQEQGEIPDAAFYWGSVLRSALTLFKIVTDGMSWDLTVQPLRAAHWSLELVIFTYVTVAQLAVLNVVTGVFCSAASTAAQTDPDLIAMDFALNNAKTASLSRDLFAYFDADESGMVTIDEIEEALTDGRVQSILSALRIETSDAWILFNSMDDDNSQLIDLEEFVQGCCRLQGNSRSMEKLFLETRFIMRTLKRIETRLQSVEREAPTRSARLGFWSVSSPGTPRTAPELCQSSVS